MDRLFGREKFDQIVDSESSALRSEYIDNVLADMGVYFSSNDLIEDNPSRDLPYHGNEHLLTVACYAHLGAQHYGFETQDTLEMVVAALWHDYDYVLDEDSDHVNIDRAIAHARSSAASFNFDENATERIVSLIKATKFPHSAVDFLQGQILQDADMMQQLEPDAKYFIDGLSWERPRNPPSSVFFPGEEGFKTSWGSDCYKSFWDRISQENRNEESSYFQYHVEELKKRQLSR